MTIQTIDLSLLVTVTGGAGTSPAPLLLPKPVITPGTVNMGFPKYSAGWWELARASGNIK